jgi:flagellar motor switch protein FliG
MPAAAETTPPANAEAKAVVSRMTQVQKLAALLVIVGPEAAAALMKNLNETELSAVTTEMTKLTLVDKPTQEEILRDFSEVAAQASSAVQGGVDYTKAVLERFVGPTRAWELVNRIAPIQTPVNSFEALLELDPVQMFNMVKDELPQTIALIASYMPVNKVSELIVLLRPDLRSQVVERLATLGPTPVEVIERVVQVLGTKVGGQRRKASNQTGGVKAAADVLNAMEKNASKSVLTSLEDRNPGLAQSIRQKLFEFEDLRTLDQNTLQRILREVQITDLALALKTAGEDLKKALLSCITKRAAETVMEELSYMGPRKLREIESAQARVVEVVRRLDAEGEIELNSFARDEVLV